MLEALTVFLGLGGIAALVWLMVAVARVESNYDGGALCAPSRRASVPQAQRRMVEPVPPPYTFDTRPRLVPATTHVSITPAPAPRRPRRAVPEVVPMAAPVVVPVAVPDWPTRQTVEQPAQVAVNRTAARFGSLEINRD